RPGRLHGLRRTRRTRREDEGGHVARLGVRELGQRAVLSRKGLVEPGLSPPRGFRAGAVPDMVAGSVAGSVAAVVAAVVVVADVPDGHDPSAATEAGEALLALAVHDHVRDFGGVECVLEHAPLVGGVEWDLPGS